VTVVTLIPKVYKMGGGVTGWVRASNIEDYADESDKAFEAKEHLSNLKFHFFELYAERYRASPDPMRSRPLWKQYLDGACDLDLLVSRSRCEDIFAWVSIGARVCELGPVVRTGGSPDAERELSVLVLVREFAQPPRPDRAFVRLRVFNDLAEFGIDRGEVARVALLSQAPARAEVVWVVFKWKLRLLVAGREFIDGIVQRRAEVVDKFADPDRNGIGEVRFQLQEWAAALRVVATDSEVALDIESIKEGFDVRQVFLCPTVPEFGTSERLWLRHALLSV
jgi:hypothetical protein